MNVSGLLKLPWRKLWPLIAVIFAGKLLYWLILGTGLEPDSIGYIDLQIGVLHPPGYEALAGGLHWLTGSWWGEGSRYFDGTTIIVQCLIFTVAGTFFLYHFLPVEAGRGRLGVAILLALEPGSGWLCRGLMSDALCLSIFMIVLGAASWHFKNHGAIKNLSKHLLWGVGIGLVVGIGYLVRFSAVILLPALILCWLFHRTGWQKKLVWIAGLLIGFQLFLLPFRIIYKARFDTVTLNAFTGFSLWNSAAYLYPEWDPAQPLVNPDFDSLVAEYGTSTFDLSVTWNTAHIYGEGTPAYDYWHSPQTPQINPFHFSRELNKGARKLITRQPGRHLVEFVIPNFTRPFLHNEITEGIMPTPGHPVTLLADHQPEPVRYYRFFWWVGFVLLLGLTVLWFLPFMRSDSGLKMGLGLILLVCWGYLVAISLAAVLFLRFVYFPGPLLIAGVGYVWIFWVLKRKQKKAA